VPTINGKSSTGPYGGNIKESSSPAPQQSLPFISLLQETLGENGIMVKNDRILRIMQKLRIG